MSQLSGHSQAMADHYSAFRPLIDAEDKRRCVAFALSVLSSGELDIPSFYEGVLAPAARELHCTLRQRPLCVWEEHVRTSILRTVIECCYPELMKARDLIAEGRTKGPGIVVCPTEEYHELGARMAADLFTLQGFDVVFVGANTPQQDILDAVAVIHPVFVGVGVTSPYNLVPARRVIQQLGRLRTDIGASFHIVAGGQAFQTDPGRAESLGADLLAQDYEDIRRFAQELPWSSH